MTNNKQPKQLTEITVIKLKQLIGFLESPAVIETEKQVMAAANMVKDKSIETAKHVGNVTKEYVIDFMNDHEKHQRIENRIKRVSEILDQHVY